MNEWTNKAKYLLSAEVVICLKRTGIRLAAENFTVCLYPARIERVGVDLEAFELVRCGARSHHLLKEAQKR